MGNSIIDLIYISIFLDTMRKRFIDLLHNLSAHPNEQAQQPPIQQLLETMEVASPNTVSQYFFTIFLSIYIIGHQNDKNPCNKADILKLLSLEKLQKYCVNYDGSLSLYILKIHAMSEFNTNSSLQIQNLQKMFPINKEVRRYKQKSHNKQKSVNLITNAVEVLQQGVLSYESYIVYLDFIAEDILRIFHDSDQIGINNLIDFLKISLPKVLSNIIVAKDMFPKTLISSYTPIADSTDPQTIDILYNNQTLESIIKMCENYHLLIHKMMLQLIEKINQSVVSSAIRELVSLSFKYYYLYHTNEREEAELIVRESLKKMQPVVQYAVIDEIYVFFVILQKLGRYAFIKELQEEFQWAQNIYESKASRGIKKQLIVPFYSRALGNIHQITVQAKSNQKRYIEIYDRFSILYFSIRCIEYDINVRLLFIGGFDQSTDSSSSIQLLNFSKDDYYEGSIEIFQPGIYMFELDNEFSWIHKKVVTYDICVLTPIQILESNPNQQLIKQTILPEFSSLNQCTIDRIVGHLHDKEIKYHTGVANISKRLKKEQQILKIKLMKNSGEIYQYQTENCQLLFDRILDMSQSDPNIIWKIEGYQIKMVQQKTHLTFLKTVRNWIDEIQHPRDKLEHSRKIFKSLKHKNPLKTEFGKISTEIELFPFSQSEQNIKQSLIIKNQQKNSNCDPSSTI